MLQKYRTTYFPIGGERVITAQLPSGRYVAYFTQETELRGYGHSRLSAIADLSSKRDNYEPPDPPGFEAGFCDNH